MNAYELADKLDLEPYGIYGEQAANMIRQQADRIAELEKCIEFGYKDAMDIVVLNNLGAEDNHWFVWAKKLVNIDYTAPKPIEKPFYTTPQTKPLSFQEMVDCASEAGALWDTHINGDVIFKSVDAFNNFCRAIEERHGIK